MSLQNLRYFILLCCFTGLINGQEKQEFNQIASHYINGDALIIGNNIVSGHEEKPFDDFSLINDQVRMRYVDVDREGRTFSSSSATLKVPDSSATPVRVLLYWSAVYPFAKGTKRDRPDEIIYYGSGDRVKGIESVLIKAPGMAEYTEVQGTVLFDGLNKAGYEDSAPYFCYADITDMIRALEYPEGEYTVANVKASQGFVSGGVSGGWFLFFVYESAQASPKYISAYHGFASINDNTVDIELRDFKTKEEGRIDASIFAAALEGDGKLYQDKLEMLNYKDSSFVALKNEVRPSKNFFNSRISIDDKYFKLRNPNSTNTLGFDVLRTKVPFELFSNNQTSTTLRFSTKADRFYAYFAGFSIEINEIFQLEKEAIDKEKILADHEATPAQNSDESVDSEDPEVLTEATAATSHDLSNRQMEKRMRKVDIRIPGLEPGYYLISNVFSKPSYARRWETFLTSKNHEPKTFINPKNNWHYVHVYNAADIEPVYKTYLKLVKLDYFKEIWVFKINMK
ncbi:MAG: hypothetical protein HKO90_10040 [Flavobacteriaceae bacterium]|nr:hypothetical protein [Flavobacteriaceae bacterium]